MNEYSVQVESWSRPVGRCCAQAADIMSEHKEELDEIIQRNPLFADELHYYTEPKAAATAEPYDDRHTPEHNNEDPIEQFDEHSDPIEVIESSPSPSEL